MWTREQQYQKIFELWNEGAYDTVLYQTILQKAGKRDIKVDSVRKFKKLPFMTRDDLRASSSDERRVCRQEDVLAYFTSSGTTGTPKLYAFSKEDKKVQEYVTRCVYEPLGLGPGDLGLVHVPLGSGNMGHSMCWQYMVMGASFFAVDRPDVEHLRFALQNLPITTISGLPSLVLQMNDNERDREIAYNSSVRRLLVGGDILSENKRKQIENLYHAKCYDSMGMSEIFGPIGNECIAQDGIHFCNDVLFMEVIDPLTHREVEDGQNGLACYTTLWKKGSPLIRYLTDDLVSVTHERCSCGSPWPRLYYKGRIDFSFKTADNRLVTPRDIEKILYQYEYGQPYHIGVRTDNTFVLHLVQEKYMEKSSDERSISTELETLLGGNVSIVNDLEDRFEYKNHCFRKEP